MTRAKSSGTGGTLPPPPAPSPPTKTLTGERDRFGNLPALEVELVHEVRKPPHVDRPWAMLEVWTQNRVYAIDVSMRCIEVVEIATQKPIVDHGLLGARLLGGQYVESGDTFLSHPFPRPGTEAVFEQTRPSASSLFSHSSTVTRVVLRLRQLTIMTGGEEESWDQIASVGRRATLPQADEVSPPTLSSLAGVEVSERPANKASGDG